MKTRSNTVKHTASTFRSTTATATAVTVTYGTSATKVWSWKIRQTSQTYENMLVLGVTPEKAPDKGEYVTMTFEQGVPKTSVNGKEMKVSEIITELNALGGKHGIGIVDIVENRVVGMKSRGVYETPGGTILMAAHEQLEELILDRETMETKKKLGSQFAQVVYEGKWFTPLREAIQAFVEVNTEICNRRS